MPWLSVVASNVALAAVLALAAWFAQRRLVRPGVARVLWVLALVKLVTPPLWRAPVIELPTTMACALGACGCSEHSAAITLIRDRLPWILLAIWSAGALAVAWTAWRRWSHFRRLVAHARPASAEWQSLATQLAADLAIRCPPVILMAPGRLPPLVVPGWGRARLLLPESLIDRLNGQQRSALLLHELTHIERGDHWARLLELAVSIAYWWFPFVGSMARQLRACEETCCDAAVVAHLPQARREYASLLLDVVDFAAPLPRHAIPQATAMSAASDLEQRLLAILHVKSGSRRAGPAGALVLGLACVMLPCGVRYDFAGAKTSPKLNSMCCPTPRSKCDPDPLPPSQIESLEPLGCHK